MSGPCMNIPGLMAEQDVLTDEDLLRLLALPHETVVAALRTSTETLAFLIPTLPPEHARIARLTALQGHAVLRWADSL